MPEKIDYATTPVRDIVDKKIKNDKGLVVEVDSIFVSKDQILVRDKATGMTHSLKEHPWEFVE